MPALLQQINSPDDLKKLSHPELTDLADEIREEIVRVVQCNGGHLGSNLGAVELTIALHYCYSFSKDCLLWDVGHQTYAHKLLTGRRDCFGTLRCMGGISGFPNKKESPYDRFTTGHSGTAISTALGLACGDAITKNDRKIVAVVGDGAIASGMPFEALNHAGALGRNILVVLNDNKMSISKSVGALSAYLTQVRSAPEYVELKHEVAHLLKSLPVGAKMTRLLAHVKDGIRSSMTPGRIFEDLGFRYFGPTEGHDLQLLIHTLEHIKDMPGPILLHVVTEKGRGHDEAQKHHHRMHSVPPPEKVPAQSGEEKPGWTSRFCETLVSLAHRDPKIVAITAAMPDVTAAFQKEFAERHFDPGICEQHAVGLASGLAAAGMKPVVAIYSTFLQRAYDQAFQEICLQEAPVVLAIDRAGLVGSDGPTHHGVFDIAYLRHLPEITLMAPKDTLELASMLEAALAWQRPCAIRFPRECVPDDFAAHAPIERGKAEVLREGTRGLIIAYGCMVWRAMKAADLLHQQGIDVTVVNARFAKPLDETVLLDLIRKSAATITVEDGCLAGGFGSAVLELLSERGITSAPVARMGVPDRFVEHGRRDELLRLFGLCPEGIAAAMNQALEQAAR